MNGGAACVILDGGGRVLLVKENYERRRWTLPGGAIDADETPWDAAVREVAEETGLRTRHLGEARVWHIDVHPAARGHTHIDLRYLLGGDDRDPCPPPGESPHVAWFPFDTALVMADEALAGGLRRVAQADVLAVLRDERPSTEY